jgi:hypothetical protein
MTFGAGDRDGRSLGTLITSITEDMSSLVRGEIALAKAEMKQSARNAGAGAGLLVAAALLVSTACFLLLFAAVYGLVAAGLPTWASFLIVAVVLILIAAILGFLGKKRFDQVKGPERAQEQREATRRVLSSVPQRFKEATERSKSEPTVP